MVGQSEPELISSHKTRLWWECVQLLWRLLYYKHQAVKSWTRLHRGVQLKDGGTLHFLSWEQMTFGQGFSGTLASHHVLNRAELEAHARLDPEVLLLQFVFWVTPISYHRAVLLTLLLERGNQDGRETDWMMGGVEEDVF